MSVGIDGSNANVLPDLFMSVAAFSSAPSAVPSPAVATPERTIASRVLGDQVVSADSLLRFPEGLHGFESSLEFALVPAARDGFYWLQSTEEAGLAFLLVDPFRVAPDYELDLGAGDEQFLELAALTDALVLTVVTLPSSKGAPATTNLRGPIVINTHRCVARQVVTAVDGYSLHAEFSLG